MANEHLTSSPIGEFVMFASGDGKVRVECRFESDTLWLSQAMICELYGKAKATISEHIKHIFEEGELEENSVVRFYRTTASDGKNYQVQLFSLPLILAVGYRVRSPRGTQFRQWATQTLKQYLIKGFVMDDERLKNPPVVHRLYPTISMRCWSASEIFAPANAVFICAYERYLPAVLAFLPAGALPGLHYLWVCVIPTELRCMAFSYTIPASVIVHSAHASPPGFFVSAVPQPPSPAPAPPPSPAPQTKPPGNRLRHNIP